MGSKGRNGGHLTANAFDEFAAYAALFGEDEAKRALALEVLHAPSEKGRNGESSV